MVNANTINGIGNLPLPITASNRIEEGESNTFLIYSSKHILIITNYLLISFLKCLINRVNNQKIKKL